MVRLTLYANGHVEMKDVETGKVLRAAYVTDLDRAQEIMMKALQKLERERKENGDSQRPAL